MQIQQIQQEFEIFFNYEQNQPKLIDKLKSLMDQIFQGILVGKNLIEENSNSQNLTILAQYLQILRFMVDGLTQDTYYTKRELFYKSTLMFDNQEQVNLIIKKLSYILQVPRRQLHIVSASKGLVCGAIELLNDEVKIDVRNLTSQGKGFNITEFMDEWQIKIHGKRILVVEKETVYFRIIKENQQNLLQNTVIITGKGYPCNSTKHFLKYISIQNPEIPVYYLGDMDPHGFDILCQYAFGNEMNYYEFNTVPWIQWLNLHLQSPKNTMQLTNKEKVLLNTLLERQELYIEWKIAMQIDYKFEVEDLETNSLSLVIDEIFNT